MLIRKAFCEEDLIETVIGLAPNLFYGTGIPPSVIILRSNKHAQQKNKIRFINAENLFKKGRNQNTLEVEHVESIINLYEANSDLSGNSFDATLDEIRINKFNLSIALYVEAVKETSILSISDALKKVRDTNSKLMSSRARVKQELAKWSFDDKK
jgi:type I restriction enzyme M protein